MTTYYGSQIPGGDFVKESSRIAEQQVITDTVFPDKHRLKRRLAADRRARALFPGPLGEALSVVFGDIVVMPKPFSKTTSLTAYTFTAFNGAGTTKDGENLAEYFSGFVVLGVAKAHKQFSKLDWNDDSYNVQMAGAVTMFNNGGQIIEAGDWLVADYPDPDEDAHSVAKRAPIQWQNIDKVRYTMCLRPYRPAMSNLGVKALRQVSAQWVGGNAADRSALADTPVGRAVADLDTFARASLQIAAAALGPVPQFFDTRDGSAALNRANWVDKRADAADRYMELLGGEQRLVNAPENSVDNDARFDKQQRGALFSLLAGWSGINHTQRSRIFGMAMSGSVQGSAVDVLIKLGG